MCKRASAVIIAAAVLIICISGCNLAATPQQPSALLEPGRTQPESTFPSEKESEAPPEQTISKQDVPVVLYLSNANADGFITKEAMTSGTAEHIVSLLVDEKTLPDGCALLSFSQDGDSSGIADMNKVYGQAIGEGTAAEYIRLGVVVNTLLTFFELTEITITIEGEVPNTGHEIYDYPLKIFADQSSDIDA